MNDSRLRVGILLLVAAATACISAFSQSSPEARISYSESKSYSPRQREEKKPKKDKKQKTQLESEKTIASVTPPEGTLTIPVGVYDNHGLSILGLEQRDFHVFIDGIEVEIQSVRTKPHELDVVLLLDISPSGINHLKTIKSVAAHIVDQLRPQDKVTIVTFGAGVKIRVDRSLDRALILKAIQKLEMSDGTAFYDAMSKVSQERTNSRTNPVGLIVISDGVDTTSKSSYPDSLADLEKGSFTTYVFFLDTFAEATEQFRQPLHLIPPGSSLKEITEDYQEARDYLDDLGDLSGGQIYLPSSDVNVAEEMGSRYYVTVPAPVPKPGFRHSIKVRVTRSALQILAKGSLLDP